VSNPHIFWFIFGLPKCNSHLSSAPSAIPPSPSRTCFHHPLLLFTQEHPVLFRYFSLPTWSPVFLVSCVSYCSTRLTFPRFYSRFLWFMRFCFSFVTPSVVSNLHNFVLSFQFFRFPKNVTKSLRGWHSGVKQSRFMGHNFYFWNSEVVCFWIIKSMNFRVLYCN